MATGAASSYAPGLVSQSLNGPISTRLHGEQQTMGAAAGLHVLPSYSRQNLQIRALQSDHGAPVTSVPGSLIQRNQLHREPESYKDKGTKVEEMKEWIEEIRERISSTTDGEISISPYETAWAALVPAFDGSDGPQFPKILEWIVANQFSDGSWGDEGYFQYYDRVCNTLACIIALKTWKTGSAAVEKGLKFVQKNLQAIEEEKSYRMMGFELVFQKLISNAKSLDLDLPYNAPVLLKIAADRDNMLAQISMDILHTYPTLIQHCLEGFHELLDWEKLLKLRGEDGSFLCSPAATASCLLHTKDEKALGFLSRLLDRFGNAVPNTYPIDIFERLRIVDRLEHLGIDRYFEKEIKDILEYVSKRSVGVGWARGTILQDLDDTSMGFRLLRQHGYDIKEDVFQQFKGNDSQFYCFAGQQGRAVTGLYNFYRATQTRFPGESLLETGERFARSFLTERYERNECADEWIIMKDLPGEIEHALASPWYCSLPWLDTAAYIGHYGPDDIWIGKSLYRVPLINNHTYLKLAKADFNLCQAKHQEDLQNVTRWNEDCGFGKLPFARQKAIEGVFAGACVLPAPEFSPARLVWARNCVLTTVVDDYFDVGGSLPDMRKFVSAFKAWNPSLMDRTAEEAQIVFSGLYNTLNAITQEGTIAQGRDIGQHLQKIWLRWLESCLTEAEWTASAFSPSFDEYMNNALPSIALEPIVLSTLFFLGEPISDEFVNDSQKLRLMELTNRIGRLLNDVQGWKRENSQKKPNAVSILLRENPSLTEEEVIANLRAKVEESMLELVRDVHQQSPIAKSIRQLHFNMARIMHLFYQKTDGFTDRSAMANKLKKVLFHPWCKQKN